MPKKHTATIFARIFLPLFLVMLLQSAIFYFVTVFGHTVSTLDQNATDILTERVDNRQNELESMLTSQWGNMSVFADALNRLHQQYDNEFIADFSTDAEQQKSFLEDSSDTLFKMIRNNAVNGVFVILTNSDEKPTLNDKEQSYYGLCIRDYDINSGYTDKEDLLLERSPSSLNTSLGCSLDSYWEALYTFSSSGQKGDFFYKPLMEAYDNPGVSADNFRYFCEAHTYSAGDRPVVSYSIPLIDSAGHIYGVMGVELLTSYLSSLLPSSELLAQDTGAYMLVKNTKGSSVYSVISTSGTLFQRCFGDTDSITMDMTQTLQGNENLISYNGKQDIDLCCYISPMTVYNQNTPFEDELISIVGVVQEDELFSVSHQIRTTLLWVTATVLVIGFAAIFLVSHLLTRPIKRLATEVKEMEPDDDAKLEHINIQEIDQLVDAIENQSRRINQTKVRTEFLSRMSHDMRTPMNAIIGFSSPELLEGSDDTKLLEYLGKINGSGKYLLGLINEVLDMTKIDSGKMEIEKKAFSLETFWTTTLSMIDELAVQRNIRFVKNLPSASGHFVIGDPQRLSQILVNLLSNAVKFTPKGGTVTLTVEQSYDIMLSLKITVKDTGVGMSEEFQKKLYQPFEQEHTNREGIGLGLSIAHQLVSHMGGSIDCESKLGLGTTFTVKLQLPFAEAPKALPERKTQSYSEAELHMFLSGRRVLLCEDHPLNQQIASRLLIKQNMKVEIAGNGEIGCEKFMNSPVGYYDAVLMDIRMPVMNGLEATEAIRRVERPDAKTIPIIAMTANAFQEDVDATRAAGMNEHLSKPIEPQKLYQILASYLDAQRDSDER